MSVGHAEVVSEFQDGRRGQDLLVTGNVAVNQAGCLLLWHPNQPHGPPLVSVGRT
ncbi:hypothetical protein ACWDCL_26670 [Streptomyces sp. NPDC001009]